MVCLSSSSTNNSLWCIVHSSVSSFFFSIWFFMRYVHVCLERRSDWAMCAVCTLFVHRAIMVLIEKHVHISFIAKPWNSMCWICCSLYYCLYKFVLL
jgi:hypothetical protein